MRWIEMGRAEISPWQEEGHGDGEKEGKCAGSLRIWQGRKGGGRKRGLCSLGFADTLRLSSHDQVQTAREEHHADSAVSLLADLSSRLAS